MFSFCYTNELTNRPIWKVLVLIYFYYFTQIYYGFFTKDFRLILNEQQYDSSNDIVSWIVPILIREYNKTQNLIFTYFYVAGFACKFCF